MAYSEYVEFKGERYCWSCGVDIEEKEFERSGYEAGNTPEDSNVYPQFRLTSELELDAPDHCAMGAECLNRISHFDGDPKHAIGMLLNSRLTDDGRKYVIEAISNSDSKSWSNELCMYEWYEEFNEQLDIPKRFAAKAAALNWAKCFAYNGPDNTYYVGVEEGDMSDHPWQIFEEWQMDTTTYEQDGELTSDDLMVVYIFYSAVWEYPRLKVHSYGNNGQICEIVKED